MLSDFPSNILIYAFVYPKSVPVFYESDNVAFVYSHSKCYFNEQVPLCDLILFINIEQSKAHVML